MPVLLMAIQNVLISPCDEVWVWPCRTPNGLLAFFFFFFLPLHCRTILHLASFFHTPHFYSIECLFCILHFRVAKILQYQSE